MTSWRIARPFGIDVYIHWTFWLLPLWIFFTFQGSESFPLWLEMLVLPPAFACVVMHELGHALTARQFGIGTQSITLSPLGGIAQLDRMSHQPFEEFCIAIAGPMVNVVLAGLLGVALIAGHFAGLAEAMWMRFLTVLFAINVIMVVFNMIPAFPMDGGRVLRALLTAAFGLLPGTRIAVLVGSVVAGFIGLAGFFLLGSPWLLLIALFVIWAGHMELASLESADRLRRADDLLSRRPMDITVSTWDTTRGGWVHRSYTVPRGRDDFAG